MDSLASVGAAAAPPDDLFVSGVKFAHSVEAEFARLLDFYGVPWLYEPDEFPLEWDGDRIVKQFRPDFYLPEYDLYIELTVMKQSLVRRKNRKLRLLRSLYPDIQIKLLYRRDIGRLLAGFGLPVSPDDQIAPSGAERAA
ncbi:MAG: hypothetical protein ACR2M0_00120 [Chloroflexia bacterium]